MSMTTNKGEMQVKALRNGTVIDHIPSDKLFKVVSILQLDQTDQQVTIGYNLSSRLLGKKGIIKVSEHFLEEQELNRISLIAPNAKINIIRDYEVVEKRTIGLPQEIHGIVKCVNPKCITNNEPMMQRYTVVSKDPIVLKCHYCEREMSQDEIKLL